MGQGNIIGYEINEKTCQISFYNEEMAEPETMEVDADNYQIPLAIGKLSMSASCAIASSMTASVASSAR